MNIELSETPFAHPWVSRLARLRTRASKPALRESPARLAEVTDEALDVGVAMLQELAQQHSHCAQLRGELNRQIAEWEHLFEVMPTACLITDEAGLIVEANGASRAVLNISPKSLRGRALVVFFEDRSAFKRISQDVRARQAATVARLTVRPRERRPSEVPAVVAPAGTSRGEWMVWFLGGVVESPLSVDEVRGQSPRPVTCEDCGTLAAQDHELADCVAVLRQQVDALRTQIEIAGPAA